jgi:hypothetical protein
MITLINYQQLVSDLIPDPLYNHYSGLTAIINTKERDWNYLLTSGITDDYNTFVDYYNDTMFKVNHNGQLLSLEHYLNNEFLPMFPLSGQTIYTSSGTTLTYGQIYIDDGPANLFTYVYKEIEPLLPTQNTYVYKKSESGITSGYTDTFIYIESELYTSGTTADFIVYMAYDDYNNTAYRTLVDKAVNIYKPAGRQYTIVGY